MDPFTWIAIAVMLAGAATSFVGAQKSADAAEDAGKAQQEAAAAAARNEELQTAENVRRERVNNRRRLARLRADLGQTGLAMGGSLQDAFTETAGRMELASQDQTRAGNMNAGNIRSQGDMALWEARNQAIGTRISSYGTLLSDASSIGSYASKA
jgi:hypothetical protein